jgi:hypothetical protein
MRARVTRSLFQYFTTLIGEPPTAIPARRQIMPEQVGEALPYMAIMDCERIEAPKYRLAGTIYSEYFGIDPTGRDYLDFVPPARHGAAIASFKACLEHRCGMLMQILGASANGQERVTESIALPVRDDATGRPRFLYISDVALEEFGWTMDKTLFTKRIEVQERLFIDLGFGHPARYLDHRVR